MIKLNKKILFIKINKMIKIKLSKISNKYIFKTKFMNKIIRLLFIMKMKI